jgi:MAP/microtubule affinity-regulating kinase
MLREKKRINEDDARTIFKQLVDAMDYVHKQSVIHRDLKLENIMLKEKDKLHIVVIALSQPINPT